MSRASASVFRAAAGPSPGAAAVRDDRELAAARMIVSALDRYHLDPIIGLLVPGLGDIITTIVGAYLVTVAARRGVPPIVIARMLLNLGVDAAVGLVPVVGDVADFAIRANQKNLKLLELRSHQKSTWRDWLAVGGAATLVVGTFGLAIYAVVRLVGAVF